jgi:hypothetical protein
VDDLTGDVSSSWREEERDRRSDVVRVACAFSRGRVDQTRTPGREPHRRKSLGRGISSEMATTVDGENVTGILTPGSVLPMFVDAPLVSAAATHSAGRPPGDTLRT